MLPAQPFFLLYCLQPTYEGLKLVIGEHIPVSLPSLQPTYEGLKPLTGYKRTSEFSLCLQPTYEGLKRHSWAPELYWYLLFVAYLRGIETIYQRQTFFPLSQRLQPTYEGLKPSTLHPVIPVFDRFVAYLRGIETQWGSFRIVREKMFVAYLRGIETPP